MATMACDPLARVEVVKVACPAFNIATPRKLESSRKITVPLGVLFVFDELFGIFTSAVNVTSSPAFDGLAEAVSVVVVEA